MLLSVLQNQKSDKTILRWLRLTFVYFFIVAILGIFLRLLFFQPIRGVWYDNFLHAHSHFAMLGWVFNFLFIALLAAFVPERIKNYRILFWLAQIGALGMLLSFPIEGYAFYSISFTTLHVVVSWVFAFKFLHDIRGKSGIEYSLIRWALGFMIVANVGPFGLGVAMGQGGSGSSFADLSLYYYLHFQYNGWFTLAVLALFFKLVKGYNIKLNTDAKDYFVPLIGISCILSFTLSMLWLQPGWRVYLTGYASAIGQVAALYLLWKFLYENHSDIKRNLSRSVYVILVLSFIAFVLKIAMQLASAFPEVASMAFEYRDLIIGYLHIIFIGFISFFLFAWLLQKGLLKISSKWAVMGMWVFLIGFILSELLIFGKPLVLLLNFSLIPAGIKLLFLISVLMPLGIILIYAGSNLAKADINESEIQEKQTVTQSVSVD